MKYQERASIAHRSRGSAPRPAHSLRDTRPELLHVKELVDLVWETPQEINLKHMSSHTSGVNTNIPSVNRHSRRVTSVAVRLVSPTSFRLSPVAGQTEGESQRGALWPADAGVDPKITTSQCSHSVPKLPLRSRIRAKCWQTIWESSWRTTTRPLNHSRPTAPN
ncbi:unnamed protein product, partial [Pleuronectes platessa]